MNNSDSAVTSVSATVTRPERVFPTLTSEQVARMAAHRGRRTTTPGEVLVEVGVTCAAGTSSASHQRSAKGRLPLPFPARSPRHGAVTSHCHAGIGQSRGQYEGIVDTFV